MVVLSDVHLPRFKLHLTKELLRTALDLTAGRHGRDPALFADKYAAENVRMNNVLPGFIDSLPENPDFMAKIPMGRYGSSYSEIAATVAFLASEGGAYITGQNIRVDGGITRSV